jgi:hypothetical protein
VKSPQWRRLSLAEPRGLDHVRAETGDPPHCGGVIDYGQWSTYGHRDGAPSGIKRERSAGERVPNAAAAPATVSGESSGNSPLGLFPGKATEGGDPQVRRPAVSRGHTRARRSGSTGDTRPNRPFFGCAGRLIRGDVPQACHSRCRPWLFSPQRRAVAPCSAPCLTLHALSLRVVSLHVFSSHVLARALTPKHCRDQSQVRRRWQQPKA